MISLLVLKKFIAEKKSVNLSLILQTFSAKQEEILAILELLIHKGCVKKCVKIPNCATRCLKCTPDSFALYQWVEQPCLTPSAS
ncbi:MAG: FeoC-like transcriptional regulator [Candidatus Aquirickettsiella sp.]